MMRLTLTLPLWVAAVSAYTDIVHKRFMLKNIDPIVLPGQYTSHMHSFFGSDAVTKVLPTTEELQKGCPSGENPNDLSVYWIPTMYYVNGDSYEEVNPAMFSTYYENINHAEIAIPPNYHAVAGNSSANSQTDINEHVTAMTWWCETGPEDRSTRPRATLPRNTCNTHIQVILRFPDCVNPDDLKQNAYAAASPGNRCPATMKRIPQLRFSIRYDVRRIIPQGWTGAPPLKLACGDIGEGYCFHGDFVNGWFDDAGKNMLKATSTRDFLRVDGTHGLGKAGTKCKPTDADAGHGTSDYATSIKMMEAN